MEQAHYQIPNQHVATNLLQEILSRKCKIHRIFDCEYIHVKPSEFSPRLCCKCMEERNIPPNEYVSIRLLLDAYSNTIFNAYPKLSDNSVTQKIQQFQGTCDKVAADISSFFNNLQSSISSAIENQKCAQKENLSQLSACYQNVFDALEQISQIEEFQKLVKSDNNNNEEQLKQFINYQYSQADYYTEILNSQLLEYQKIYERFSLDNSNNVITEIFKLIEKISLFSPTLQSQVVYDEYISLIDQGLNSYKLILSGMDNNNWMQQQTMWRLGGVYPTQGFHFEQLIQQIQIPNSQIKCEWEYADTYQKWQQFSEEQRQEQMKILNNNYQL